MAFKKLIKSKFCWMTLEFVSLSKMQWMELFEENFILFSPKNLLSLSNLWSKWWNSACFLWQTLPNMFFYCLLFRIFVATKESWINTDYYHRDQFHPMQMTYHPPGSPQSEHHGQIHDDERNHKVYIPNENELRPGSIPNRRKLLRQSQNFRGNTYFRQISRR